MESVVYGGLKLSFFRKKISEVEKEFYNEFQEEEKELIVLVKEKCAGAFENGGFFMPCVRYIAAIDPETNELKQENGSLCWITPRKHRGHGWGFNFKRMTIYKVLVRKCYEKELNKYQSEAYNRRWLVLKVIDKIKSEPRLDSIREEYLTPVYIDDDKLGKFSLNRAYGQFEGNIDWMKDSISIELEIDEENASTAERAFTALKNIASDIQNWDKKIREYAAKKLTGLANDWNKEDNDDTASYGKITEEEFARRVCMMSISFYSDSSLDFILYDDDIFFSIGL